ncbi:MAG: glycosyltransferase family 4 protein [Anaerolineales bacterium]
MKILLLSRYGRLGASSRVRFYQYLPYLRERGVEVDVAPFFDDDYLRALYAGKPAPVFSVVSAYAKRFSALARSARYDLLWIEKQLLPWLPAWFEPLLSRPYVVDYDDAVFHRYDQHSNPLIRAALGGSIDRVMRGARLVVAGNDYLRARALQAGAPWVEILPSVVDAGRYSPAPESSSAPEKFTLGWVGQPVTVAFLRLIESALQAARLQTEIRLSLVGASLPGLDAAFLPWSEAGEVEAIQQFSAGIMPLPDAPFERGKCGYKLIQYMACGLPVIASPVGANAQIVEDGRTGFLAETPQQWTEAILALAQSPALRREMGRAGRARFEANYSLQVAAPRLLAFLRQAVL